MGAFALPPEQPRLPSPYRPELAVVRALAANVPDEVLDWSSVMSLARPWVEQVRANPAPFWAMESLLREFPITSYEGLALMRLAEALLRVPDIPSAIALTADQLGRARFDGNSHEHAGDTQQQHSLFASLSASAIALSKKFLPDAEGSGGVLTRLGAETVVAATVRAIQLLGRQFVLGRTIQEAMEEASRARRRQARLRFSYDMLGEGARTDADARRYHAAYLHAIAAIASSPTAGSAASPAACDGISIKLSALFSRYEILQRERVFTVLLPRVWQLIEQAAAANINLTMDAEEVERLELSLEVFEALVQRIALQFPYWQGFGLAVQAYQTRALELIHVVADIARRHQLRFMVRLVKGAYWDGEIKRAQEMGLPAYPVFTHKPHTDASYLACAKALFDHADVIYPQFASHNAGTIAAIVTLAKKAGAAFELQRLHGMGEGVYREVLKDPTIACRVYAPVGEHKDLLAYLVRRLLENGANSSFVHQLADPSVAPPELLASPLTQLSEKIALPLPRDLFRDQFSGLPLNGRLNSIGLDLADYPQRATILQALNAAHIPRVAESTADDIQESMTLLSENFPVWNSKAPHERATILRRAADVLESRLPEFCALLIKEAFKTAGDAVAEVREAVDFLRYYADESETLQAGYPQQDWQRGDSKQEGRGVFVCISPWNFPLAIFTGQIAAALVTGNTVAAKPAEQTPFIAARMVELLYQAGVPFHALIMLHGAGERVGAALVAHGHCAGVCFTGSTQVAQIIHRVLASKPGPLLPLIAETGGINAMLVDSTALPEQVVDAVVHSAFRSAGQRCSALRLLCLHDSIADSVIEMLAGAMQSLQLGDPTDLATDVGPLIDDEAFNNINDHISRLKREARLIYEVPRTELSSGKSETRAEDRIIAPVAFEIGQIGDLGAEIFGPVLHVMRWQGEPDSVVAQINALGYGLTMGIHTRIDSRALQLAAAARVGNVYVNRNMIGAVVGVQPFGGEGLSGTGPKAGGPFYLRRFVAVPQSDAELSVADDVAVTMEDDTIKSVLAVSSNVVVDTDVQARLACLQQGFTQWSALALELRASLISVVAKALPSDCSQILERMVAQALVDFAPHTLPGPTGESNELRTRGRGVFVVLGAGATAPVLAAAASAALLAGNAVAVVPDRSSLPVAQTLIAAMLQAGVPAAALQLLEGADHSIVSLPPVAGVVFTRVDSALARVVQQQVAHRPGAILPVLAAVEACDALQIYRFATEQTLSINTAAAGGNAALLSGRHTA